MATPLRVFVLELTASIGVVDPVADRITNKYGDRVVADAKKEVPKDTRSLMKSIKAQRKGLGRITITAGGPSSPNDVDYAGYVHDGTVNMPPRPFLRNAQNKNLPKFEKEMADVMELLHAGRPGRVSGSIGR